MLEGGKIKISALINAGKLEIIPVIVFIEIKVEMISEV